MSYGYIFGHIASPVATIRNASAWKAIGASLSEIEGLCGPEDWEISWSDKSEGDFESGPHCIPHKIWPPPPLCHEILTIIKPVFYRHKKLVSYRLVAISEIRTTGLMQQAMFGMSIYKVSSHTFR